MSTADTGHLATLALSITGAVGNIINIGSVDHERPKVGTSHLLTTDFETYIPGDLDEPGEFEVEVEFDTEIGIPDRGVPETITITYPLREDELTAANHAGTGFVRKTSTPVLKTNERQVMKLLVAFDGLTGPTFTPAVDAP